MMRRDPSEISQSSASSSVPSADLGFATVDLDRERRTGFPEVVMGEGKSTAQVAQIAKRIYDASKVVLVTRSGPEAYEAVKKLVPSARFLDSCGAIWADDRCAVPEFGGVLVVSAGTADMAVADEAEIVAKLMLCEVKRVSMMLVLPAFTGFWRMRTRYGVPG